jgi:hypothetical protein
MALGFELNSLTPIFISFRLLLTITVDRFVDLIFDIKHNDLTFSLFRKDKKIKSLTKPN